MTATPDFPMTRDVVITRVFDAPRALVWKAWTDPERLARWWGPHGFTNPVCELDPRPGGALWIVMCGPDGTAYPMSGTIREIVEPERLVFTAVAEDTDGHALLEALTTVTFVEEGGRTTLTVTARAIGLAPVAARMLEGMEAGWTQSLERLGRLLGGFTVPETQQPAC